MYLSIANRLRSTHAIIIGLAADIIFSITSERISISLLNRSLEASDRWKMYWEASPRLTMGIFLLIAIGLPLVGVLIGSYITGSLSERNKIRNSIIMGVLSILTSLVASSSDEWRLAQIILWTTTYLLTIPVAYMGGYLSTKRKTT